MRGQDRIISQRMNGYVPSIVFLNDYPCKTDWFDHKEHATVCTSMDALSSLDLRFLVGLRVSITATTLDRAQSLFERTKLAGASVVAACHLQPGVHHTQQNGWTEIFYKEEVV